MGCCSANKNSGNGDIINKSKIHESQTKKNKWLAWIGLLIIFGLLIFSTIGLMIH